MNLNDQIAAVTGASGGVGAATAHRPTEAGVRIIAGHNGKLAEATKIANALPGSGQRAMRIPMLKTNAIREVAAMVERMAATAPLKRIVNAG
jgi:3-oxoacyl-[acyl-carrier protein] reductase